MRCRIVEWMLAIVVALACNVAPVAGEDVAPGLKVGDTLDAGNAQLAKDLLPPEILKHYEKGDYKNKIVAYPLGQAKWEKSFLDATEKNAGQLDVDERGTIVEKGNNKQPPYYYGIPFPVIDEKDPKAGVKIAWNQFLAYWYGGSSFNRTLVSMLSRKGIDREIVANGWFNFVDGEPPKYRQPNPNGLQSQFLGVSLKPADLQGTSSLTWRYRDPDKRDSVWAFIPALRRVRAVSPANRSDGYLGSDISGDDGFFFDGKPEDFEWKLLGKHDALRIVDPNTVSGPIPIPAVPGGGWTVITDLNPPTYGAALPGWTGAPWAPTDAALAKRPMYIVQAIPRDKYYLYGRIELWIDAETWDGAWNRKFSWGGELVHEYQMQARVNHKAGEGDDAEWLPASTMVWACAENFKMDRATLGGLRADPHSPAQRRVPLEAGLFESTSLTKYGK
ncbi:MAG TPA: DUF1329 domain-containing protein [Candidatus Acidoferrales bacterium]|nr:DUF1329 domain-containing protein [Candidatus Acidoferrales bacterium]